MLSGSLPGKIQRGAVGLSLLVTPLLESDPHATRVVDYSPGTGFGIFAEGQSLGPPRGGGLTVGSLHVASLGVGGSLTLGFDVTIMDGPGADIAVFENAFLDFTLAGAYSETAYVEVSTDGVVFARFPTSYAGPAGPLSPFGTTPLGSYGGLAGRRPVLANADGNELDPRIPTEAGGSAYDLADLGRTAEVVSGAVDLDRIHFVRLVDAVDGELDKKGNTIWDNSGPAGSADIDAVTALNHTGNRDNKRPVVDLRVDGGQDLHVIFEDAQGMADIVEVTATLSFVEIDLMEVLAQFELVEASKSRVHFVLERALAGTGIQADLTVSVCDASGRRSSDQVTLH